MSFSAWFRATFGEDFPGARAAALLHLEDTCWATSADARLRPSALMEPAFPDLGHDWTAAGAWGHGLASPAFYLVDVAGPHRAFFRLSLGSAYGDAARDAAEIVRVLEGYESFVVGVRPRLARSELAISIGNFRADLEVRHRDGSIAVVHDAGPPRARPGGPAPAPSTWWPWLEARIASAAAVV